jgi:hypothetical protein
MKFPGNILRLFLFPIQEEVPSSDEPSGFGSIQDYLSLFSNNFFLFEKSVEIDLSGTGSVQWDAKIHKNH